LGAGWLAERSKQSRIGPQPLVDLDDPAHARQTGDEDGIQFVDRRVTHRLLRDVHPLTNGSKQVDFFQLEAERRQTGARRASTDRVRTARLQHWGYSFCWASNLQHGSYPFPNYLIPGLPAHRAASLG